MRNLNRTLFAAALLLAAAAPARAQGDPPIVRDAKEFMQGYAADLRSGNVQGIVDRYSRRGAHMVGSGESRLMPFDSIRAQYLGEWRKPQGFDWSDLAYEPAGPDAVAVVGKFRWTVDATRAFTFTYTSLLVREDGHLRIRVENEDPSPPPRS